MREILFRGKRVDNGEWVYGMPCATEQSGIYAIQTLQGGIFDVIPETIGQFTGLPDKNGKKIFGGDIIQNRNDRFFIEYVVGIAGFVARAKSETDWTPCVNTGTMKHYEVIGNIHDNPELLKVGE